jgi:hypothetical protein
MFTGIAIRIVNLASAETDTVNMTNGAPPPHATGGPSGQGEA